MFEVVNPRSSLDSHDLKFSPLAKYFGVTLSNVLCENYVYIEFNMTS